MSRLMPLFSNGTKASIMSESVRIPWLTVNMDLMGLSTKAIEIMMVHTLMLVPVIQNMKRVMRICFEGDLENSQAFYTSSYLKAYILENFKLS